MGTIDEVKEILNTLRIAMSILFGIILILTGSLVKRYDLGNIDNLFWIGINICIDASFSDSHQKNS